MDVLSDVITVMRTGLPEAARFVHDGPWSRWFPPVPGAAGFQIVLEGTVTLHLAEGDPIRLGPGDLVFRPHGRGHTLTGESSAMVTVCGAYRLDPARAHPLLLTMPEIVHLPAVDGPLRAAVNLLDVELSEPGLGTEAVLPALLDTLLVHLLRAWIHDRPDAPQGWAAALADPVVATALDAIHRDPAHPWTVASLAAEAGLSRAPFARRFAALAGRPPLAYLTWWRLTTAARRLRETTDSLAVIAENAGYSSEFAFAAAFKRLHGIPPGRYRRAGRAVPR